MAIAKGIAIRIIEIPINQVTTVAILIERIGRISDRQITANIAIIVNFRKPLVISRQETEQAWLSDVDSSELSPVEPLELFSESISGDTFSRLTQYSNKGVEFSIVISNDS